MKQSKREDEFAINSRNVMAFLVVEEVELLKQIVVREHPLLADRLF